MEMRVMSNTIETTLDERDSRYGLYKDHAQTSQELKEAMQKHEGWADLNYMQKESLEMIAHKIARILNGDPYYKDNWHDIAGYATLVERGIDNV